MSALLLRMTLDWEHWSSQKTDGLSKVRARFQVWSRFGFGLVVMFALFAQAIRGSGLLAFFQIELVYSTKIEASHSTCRFNSCKIDLKIDSEKTARRSFVTYVVCCTCHPIYHHEFGRPSWCSSPSSKRPTPCQNQKTRSMHQRRNQRRESLHYLLSSPPQTPQPS